MSLSDKTNAEDLYSKYMQFAEIMLEDHDVMEIAAVMAAQSLSFYKTFMSEEDYQRIVKSIYDRRNEVKTFE